MTTLDNVLNAQQLCYEGDLDSQVVHILQTVRLSRNEVENLSHLFNDLQGVLQSEWPGCQVYPFGSIVTGLGIKSSDVDCYVALPYGSTPTTNCVIQARNRMRRFQDIFAKLFAITTAKVPIVKFMHVPTQCNCDVNFKSPAGVRNSKLIAHLLHIDNRFLNLAILIKYWSKVHLLTGTNRMPNYALTMLVIFYLQQKNIVPSICQLQNNVGIHIVDNWNTAFDENNDRNRNNNDTLYELLGGFFKYYNNFNFEENIVSPFTGHPIKRKLFETMNSVPDEYFYYKRNVTQALCTELRIDTKFCIQDPFEHNRNCTVGMYPKLVIRVLAHLKFAAKIFEEVNKDQFLKAILTEGPHIETPPVVNRNGPKKHAINKTISHNKITKNNHKALNRRIETQFNQWRTQMKKQQRRNR